MTLAQLQALKANINSKLATVYNGRTFAQYLALQNYEVIAAWYNQASVPTVNVYRADIPINEVKAAIAFSEYVALTAVKQSGLQLLTQGNTIDATSASIRAAFGQIFSAGTSLTNLTALAQRPSTYIEALFTVSSISAVYGIMLGYGDVKDAMNS